MATTYETSIGNERVKLCYSLTEAKNWGIQERKSKNDEVIVQQVIRKDNDEVEIQNQWKLEEDQWIEQTLK